MPVPTGQQVQEMNLVIPQVMWTPCDRLDVEGGTFPLSTLHVILRDARYSTQRIASD